MSGTDQTTDQTAEDQTDGGDAQAPADETAEWEAIFEEALPSEGPNPGDDADRADVDGSAKDEAAKDAEGAGSDAQPSETADGEKAPDEDADDADTSEAEEDLTRDLSDEELEQFSPRPRRRIQALARRRRELEGQVSQLQEAAQYGEPVLKAVKEDGLTDANVKELLAIGRVLRSGDFAKFAEMVQPYMEAAEQATGKRLPKDLQERVDDGEVTPELASEIARRRYEAQAAQERAQREQQRREQGEQEQRQQAQLSTVRDALNEWENGLLSSDPDYEPIRQAVHERVQLEIKANGTPATADEAKQMAARAYEAVKKLAQPASNRRPTAPRPQSGGPTQGAQSAKTKTDNPESLDDIIDGVLG